ncbi:MAG: peptidoglycan editing factor PgeF [Acidobacteriota bacterium]|nr:peptidoglycan editing factor PgeF [Acidobacteriota bacterium]
MNSREYLECVPLAARAAHLFSTRQLELPADAALRQKNIEAFARDLGVEPPALRRAAQVHGCGVLVISGGDMPPQILPSADAVVSGAPGTACAVQIADCVPILVAGENAVAAIHAGWRGTAAGVVAEAVRALAAIGSTTPTLVAAIGPSIGPCCYQVDDRVRDAFRASAQWGAAEGAFAPDGAGFWRLDVAAVNRRMLESLGVPREQIHASGLCTACDRGRFYSYRAEGAGTGRLIAGIVAS